MSYGSVRGLMKVGVGNEFVTSVPIQGVLPMLPREGITDHAHMLELLKAESMKAKPGFADTYWEGKYLGTLASLGGIAEAANANFADGNNQESSSESLNAWYGLFLWGEATGNTKLRDLGLFLFNTERTAVEEYWFDVAATN